MRGETNVVLGIDFQNGFCYPDYPEGIELYVPGAEMDCMRFADFIKRNGAGLDELAFTLDSHKIIHIAMPYVWVDNKGHFPNVYEDLTEKVIDGEFRFNSPVKEHQERGINYCKHLLKEGRYRLTIWPRHCCIGSEGTKLFEPVYEAMLDWSIKYMATPYLVTKGSNMWVEHYSAVEAAMTDPQDTGTQMNTKFVEMLQTYDNIYAGGEALNFCFRNTFLDIMAKFDPENIKKIVFLEDCSSPVPDAPGSTLFESWTNDFLEKAKAAGMRTAKSTDIQL